MRNTFNSWRLGLPMLINFTMKANWKAVTPELTTAAQKQRFSRNRKLLETGRMEALRSFSFPYLAFSSSVSLKLKFSQNQAESFSKFPTSFPVSSLDPSKLT